MIYHLPQYLFLIFQHVFRHVSECKVINYKEITAMSIRMADSNSFDFFTINLNLFKWILGIPSGHIDFTFNILDEQ